LNAAAAYREKYVFQYGCIQKCVSVVGAFFWGYFFSMGLNLPHVTSKTIFQ